MREIKIINKHWLFSKTAVKAPVSLPLDWEMLNLPYTWNGIDGQDGGNDYYRGKCYFTKELHKKDFPAGEEIYLQFDGVNASAEVFFNGKSIAKHDGGYSTFRAMIDEIKEENLLVVAVDNSVNDSVYPQQADFTFYGGIYRDVSIIGVSKNHFDLDYYGASGIMITPEVKGDKAYVNVKTYVKGDGVVQVTVDGSVLTGNDVTFEIENPHLWNGTKDPYLYTARAELIVDSEAVDEISARFGIRSFEINPQDGFILNGREYPLRGVSRHQDRPEIGNALLIEHHKEDIDLICEMGANTVRLAHYQHSQVFYDLCDEKGLIVWAEIPYISKHLPNGLENTKSQMSELVCQNYNHPCIAVWGLSNEITMGGASDKSLIENHKILNDLVHSLDKTRPTTLAAVTMCSPDEKYVHIPDVLSYNHYFGWYGGNVSMYGPWFDNFHKKYSNKAIGISEYGCEALDWHTSDPQQGDYTEEYQAYYHEELIKQIMDRKYLWATHVWNMFDFAADARSEGGENGMNHKGLVSFDRRYRKDSFYAYKAWLSDDPFVHICSKRYVDRVEDVTRVTVYTNQNEVELFANGKSIGKQKRGKYPFFYFDVKNEGEIKLTAKAGECEDSAAIRKVSTFNEKYRMAEEGDVINWFEITTPSGYLSINDTLGDIMATFRGKLVLLSVVPTLLKFLKNSGKANKKDKKKSEGMSIAGFKISKTMIEIAKGFALKRALSMLGVKFTKEQILSLNTRLNKIKKFSR
ncbi:MAG: glycoside hydrolase family 2 protein [Acetobacter sp.]|nr:glycoside hydrolase family 2 protein [Bacteroides sp.]MCM1340154.1 glycoside hydrolase family 2 protein [Acetobacter sp.]MCM1432894.1 glycoside hydrolase family 2 protein [Clostridiales bacterium]